MSLSDKVIGQLDWLKQAGQSYSDTILNHLPEENDIISLISDSFQKMTDRLKAVSVPPDILEKYWDGIEMIRVHIISETKTRLGIKSPWEVDPDPKPCVEVKPC